MRVDALCLSRGDYGMLAEAHANWLKQREVEPGDFIVVCDRDHVTPGPWRHVPVEPGTNLGVRRNAGLHAAKNDLIAVWDDDDWSSPERLSEQVGYVERGAIATFLRDVTLVHGNRRAACPLASGWPQTLVARRAALLRCGGWLENDFFDGDTDLIMRLWRAGPVKRICGRADLYHYRQHGKNVTGSRHWEDLWHLASGTQDLLRQEQHV